MLRKWFLVPLLGSLTLLLVAADVAQAQLRGRIGSMRERRMARRGVVRSTVMESSVQDSQGSSNVRVSNYYTPASEGMADAARIRVILPDAKARILFNETATKQEGTDRLFYTPPLKGRTTNEYLIRATFTQGGREVTLDRLVSVDPGMTYVVDFTRR